MNQTRLLLVSVSVSLLLPHIVTAQACVNGDLRIEQNSETAERFEGFVQYCWNGVWSTVCALDPGRWGSNETRVACSQIGYQGDDSQWGSGCTSTTSPHFITLNCPSSEVSNLQECGVMEVEGCDCTVGTNSHATVTCQKSCSTGEIRLESRPTNREGRVEVCRNGRWGTIQAKTPSLVAEAVCQSFSLTFRSFELGTQFGYRQSKPVYVCDVSEGTLTCRDGDINNHLSDLWVTCGPMSVTTSTLQTTHPPTNDSSHGRTTTVEAIHSTGETTTVKALGAVTGVLMVLWLTTLTVLIGTCVVLRRGSKQRY